MKFTNMTDALKNGNAFASPQIISSDHPTYLKKTKRNFQLRSRSPVLIQSGGKFHYKVRDGSSGKENNLFQLSRQQQNQSNTEINEDNNKTKITKTQLDYQQQPQINSEKQSTEQHQEQNEERRNNWIQKIAEKRLELQTKKLESTFQNIVLSSERQFMQQHPDQPASESIPFIHRTLNKKIEQIEDMYKSNIKRNNNQVMYNLNVLTMQEATKREHENLIELENARKMQREVDINLKRNQNLTQLLFEERQKMEPFLQKYEKALEKIKSLKTENDQLKAFVKELETKRKQDMRDLRKIYCKVEQMHNPLYQKQQCLASALASIHRFSAGHDTDIISSQCQGGLYSIQQGQNNNQNNINVNESGNKSDIITVLQADNSMHFNFTGKLNDASSRLNLNSINDSYTKFAMNSHSFQQFIINIKAELLNQLAACSSEPANKYGAETSFADVDSFYDANAQTLTQIKNGNSQIDHNEKCLLYFLTQFWKESQKQSATHQVIIQQLKQDLQQVKKKNRMLYMQLQNYERKGLLYAQIFEECVKAVQCGLDRQRNKKLSGLLLQSSKNTIDNNKINMTNNTDISNKTDNKDEHSGILQIGTLKSNLQKYVQIVDTHDEPQHKSQLLNEQSLQQLSVPLKLQNRQEHSNLKREGTFKKKIDNIFSQKDKQKLVELFIQNQDALNFLYQQLTNTKDTTYYQHLYNNQQNNDLEQPICSRNINNSSIEIDTDQQDISKQGGLLQKQQQFQTSESSESFEGKSIRGSNVSFG